MKIPTISGTNGYHTGMASDGERFDDGFATLVAHLFVWCEVAVVEIEHADTLRKYATLQQ